MCSTLTGWIPFSIALTVFLTVPALGQTVHSNRLEISLNNLDISYDVVPAQNDGLWLLRQVRTTTGDHLEILKADTALTTRWHGFLAVDPRLQIVDKKHFGENLYILLRNRETTKRDFDLFIINREKGEYQKRSIRNFINFIPNQFQVTRTAAIIGGYFNFVPVVIHYNLDTGLSRVLPGLLNENGELNQININADGTFDVLIRSRDYFKKQTIFLRTYDAAGNLVANLPLRAEGKNHLIFGTVYTSDESKLIAGTYGARNSEFSKGIFIGRIDATGAQSLRYYEYADLANFFRYMKARREQRVKERISRRKVNGKKVRFNYRLLVNEIVPHHGQFLLVGEAFYPRYTSSDRAMRGFAPRGFFWHDAERGRVFDGYRYTHAVVIGFNQRGEITWDNSFEINDVKTFSLQNFVKVQPQQDRISLLYLFENQLRSKIIQGNEVIEGKSLKPLPGGTQLLPGRRNRMRESKLDYWYDEYFYASGIQEVEVTGHSPHKVFFVNKISYEK